MAEAGLQPQPDPSTAMQIIFEQVRDMNVCSSLERARSTGPVVLLFFVFILGIPIPGALQLSGQSPDAHSDSTRTITGLVVDGETDEPIPGATVQLVHFEAEGVRTSRTVGVPAGAEGTFVLAVPTEGSIGLRISSVGFATTTIRLFPFDTTLRIVLWPEEPDFTPVVEITSTRRSRSVEDGCCRVESINEEVQQHAPFNASPIESLRRYSSCTFGRTINTIDGLGVISLRGLEPTRLGMLYDGASLYTGLGTFFGATFVPSHALQTIRIAEGASNGAYGHGAVAGVVGLETRTPTEEAELTGSINLLGGELEPDQIDANLGYTGLLGDVGLALFGSYNEHRVTTVDEVARLERDYRRGSVLAKGNVLLDNRTELIASVLGGIEERRGEVSQTETGTMERSLDAGRIDGLLSISRLVGDEAEIRAKGAASVVELDVDDDTRTSTITQRTLFGEGVWTGFVGDHDLEFGLQARNEEVSSEERSDLAYTSTILSAYGQNVVGITDRLSALGSLRLDHHDLAGILLSPRAAVSYALGDNVSMRLMAGQGLKAEGLFDEDYRTIVGPLIWHRNDDIDFERSMTINYDVTWSWTPSASFGANGNVNVYRTQIDNKFVADPDSLAAGTLFLRNAEEPGRLLGLEVQTRATIAGGWNASVALGLIDYRQQNTDGEYEAIPFAPSLNIDALLGWRSDDLGLVFETWSSYVGPQQLPRIDGRDDESPSYTLVNLRLEKELGPIAIFAGLLNLLDAEQTETDPLVRITENGPDGSFGWGPAEGREFFAGVRWLVPLD